MEFYINGGQIGVALNLFGFLFLVLQFVSFEISRVILKKY